ncbi:MAG: endonuclease/exonuclease/phosphatase family protein [Spirochaetia bacterium]|jgi:endonuclease/exonuclease/phosphatase family metal-dependent hydrolase|nr:endonuclease/exonuclease/phosphatase family protein [Spirochaetia bacterium]
MRGRILSVFALICLCGFRCSLPWQEEKSGSFFIASYNAHNLFDDKDDGLEYPEFSLASGKWNAELYRKRLENAAEALRCLGAGEEGFPDILCLVEVEGLSILEDLASGPLKKAGYGWMACGGPDSSPIRCAILSRYSIVRVRSHGLVDAGGFGACRDILEAELELGREGASRRMSVFVCHWKSRREGEAATEPARRAAAGLLSARMAESAAESPEGLMMACGDFNESPDEFERSSRRYPTALMPDPAGAIDGRYGHVAEAWFDGALLVSSHAAAAKVEDGRIVLFSPWAGQAGYSYVYKGKEERLDGFLLGPGFADGKGLEFGSFSIGNDPKLLDSSGVPLAWSGASGYSDHLPVGCTLFWAD